MLANIRGHLKSALEILGILAPIVCLIDCIVLPVATALLPLIGHHLVHGLQDQVVSLLVLCICSPVILPGFAKHRNWLVLTMFALGVSLMLFINFCAVADDLFHVAGALVSSCLLIKANLDNKRLLSCGCHAHGHHARDPHDGVS
jgi:hypothetical protein